MEIVGKIGTFYIHDLDLCHLNSSQRSKVLLCSPETLGHAETRLQS